MTITLEKGQTLSLEKASPGLRHLHLGLGWDPIKKKGFLGFGGGADSIDLDASCLVLGADGSVLDTVWFRQLVSADGSIKHSGDNLTGDGDGDDEVITIDLTRLPGGVAALALTVHSFRQQTFDEVDNAFVRLVDKESGKEIVRYNLRDKGKHTGVVMAVLTRRSGSWEVKAVGAPAPGKVAADAASLARSFI